MNLRGAIHAAKFCAPHMGRKFNKGAIVFISSTTVQQLGFPGFSAYTAAKVSLEIILNE